MLTKQFKYILTFLFEFKFTKTIVSQLIHIGQYIKTLNGKFTPSYEAL